VTIVRRILPTHTDISMTTRRNITDTDCNTVELVNRAGSRIRTSFRSGVICLSVMA